MFYQLQARVKKDLELLFAALETAAGTAPDRPVTKNDPVFMVLEKDSDGKDVTVRKERKNSPLNKFRNKLQKGEIQLLFETPAPEVTPTDSVTERLDALGIKKTAAVRRRTKNLDMQDSAQREQFFNELREHAKRIKDAEQIAKINKVLEAVKKEPVRTTADKEADLAAAQELLEKGDIDPTAIPERTERPEPEPETSSRATLKRDIVGTWKLIRKRVDVACYKAHQKIKKDAGLAYQQAQATARATVLGRARKQFTDEEIQTRTQTLLDASPELEFLRKLWHLNKNLTLTYRLSISQPQQKI